MERSMSLLTEWGQCRLSEVTIPATKWNPRREPRPSIRYIDVSAVSRDELKIVSEATYSSNDAPSRARKIVEDRRYNLRNDPSHSAANCTDTVVSGW